VKIIHLLTDLRQGGAERLAINICDKLSETHQVYLILLKERNDKVYNIPKNVSKIICNSFARPSLKFYHENNLLEFKKILDEVKPDIIHVHTSEGYWLAAYTMKNSIKYFFHFHNNLELFEKFNIKKISFNIIRNLIYKNIFFKRINDFNVTFITISSENHLYYKRNLNNNKIILLSNAIDFNKFNSKRIVNKNLDEIKFISVGRLDLYKNQIYLIKAFELLIKTKKIKAKLILVGDGEKKELLINKANELSIIDLIEFKGNVNNVDEVLSACHVYLHAGLNEGAPLAPLEAMASGLPCVVLNTTGMKDIIFNNKNGFIINYNLNNINASINEFCSAIYSIISNKISYTNFSNEAVLLASNFDFNDYIEKLSKIYND